MIKKIKLISTPENYKTEFITSITKINTVRSQITAKAFIVLELIMLTTHFITNMDNTFEPPDTYYVSMYIIMLFAMIVFLLIFIKLGKNVPKHLISIRYTGIFFISFILIWCAGISLLDQLISGQIIVYIVAIIAIAVTPIYEPFLLLLIYLFIHSFFLILMPYFQKSAELLFANSINSITFLIMSWAISYMRYKQWTEDFNNKIILQEKNDELKRINKELEEANQKLETLSKTDSLTGVFNRFMFEIKIKDEWNRCKRYFTPLSLIMTDIDYFKLFNDNYGHQAGDYCIQQIAEVLSDCAKRSSDMVARYGGEEFIIVLPHTEKEKALELAEQMRRRVEEISVPHLHSDIADHITISLGVNTIIPSNESSIEEFINNTDKALYKAKEKRNCTCLAEISNKQSLSLKFVINHI